MVKFEWKLRVKNETKIVNYKGHKYKLAIESFPPDYRVELYDNGKVILSNNTARVDFREVVDTTLSVMDQVLQWGTKMLEKLEDCPKCGEKRVLEPLAEHDYKYEHFQGYTEMCPNCRIGLYNHHGSEYDELKREEQSDTIEMYQKNPPHIISFHAEEEAVQYLNDLQGDIEDSDDELVATKGIVKAANGIFYPVLLWISLQDSGELLEVEFFASNYENVITQELAAPYVQDGEAGLYPYQYRSLRRIYGDFHQSEWPKFT